MMMNAGLARQASKCVDTMGILQIMIRKLLERPATSEARPAPDF